MSNKKPQSTEPSNSSGQVFETELDSKGKIAVTYGAKPPKGPPDKQIHPRRRLPEVPEAPPQPPHGRDQK